MALQSATTSKTSSDGALIQTKSVLTSLVMGVINAEIIAQSIRTDLDERTYKATFTLAADVNGRTKPVEIIQTDDTRVNLNDLLEALVDNGYRVSFKAVKAARLGGTDRVKLTVAWDG